MTKKVTKKKAIKKAATKKVAKKAIKSAPTKITMTFKQAQTLQKALGPKAYYFLDKKLSEVAND